MEETASDQQPEQGGRVIDDTYDLSNKENQKEGETLHSKKSARYLAGLWIFFCIMAFTSVVI